MICLLAKIHPALFLLLAGLFAANVCVAQDANETICQKSKHLVEKIAREHYSPRPIDDEFSKLAYDYFMEQIDGGALLFTTDQRQKLAAFADKLDDELNSGKCEFLPQVERLYLQRLQESKVLIEKLGQQKIDFSKEEYFNQDKAEDGASFEQRWLKYLKLQVLKAAVDKMDSSQQYPPVALLDTLQQTMTNRISCHLGHDIERYQEAHLLHNQYLNALAQAFDPHTNYFSRSEHDEFKDALSREALSYGFEVSRNDLGQLEISHIRPGSPAWKSNTLNNGDLILAARELSGKVMDFSCLPMREVYQYLSSPQTEVATFRVRKQDGEEIELELRKEPLEVEENTIQSFVLEGEHKLGYIYLPAFYTNMNSSGESLPEGCATDVARELLKLKREGIEGLIFDLRGNGGGSMLEAIRLAGIFIDFGTISISNHRNENPHNLKDLDRGTAYQDPLLVLVNGYSASASELFAAAIQDYNRGIIVGRPTFGKSTSQVIMPLNEIRYPGCFVKITTGGFYRINGSSHQKEGVQPHILLPAYSAQSSGESQYPSALPADSVQKKSYARPLPPLRLKEVKATSNSRLQEDTAFAAMLEASKRWNASFNLNHIPLQREAFTQWYQWAVNFSLPEVKNLVYQTQNPQYLKGSSSELYEGEEVNARLMQEIDEDLYVQESYRILNDYLNFK